MTMLVSGTIVWTNETVRSNETREMNESIDTVGLCVCECVWVLLGSAS